MDIPIWLPQVSHPKYDEPTGFLRYRGSHNVPGVALRDLSAVLRTISPEGYRFSHVSGGGEPRRRDQRITWLVCWISDELWGQKHEKAQLSRFR